MSRMSLFACLFNPAHPEQGALQVTAQRCPLLSLKPLTPVHPPPLPLQALARRRVSECGGGRLPGAWPPGGPGGSRATG